MDTTIIAALIGAGATIVAALIARGSFKSHHRRSPASAENETAGRMDDPRAARAPSSISTTDRPRSGPHPGVARFWLRYWEMASAEFPELQMRRPGQAPAGSDWPQFTPPKLGSDRRIIHKWVEGCVDLEFRGAAPLVEQIRDANQAVLPSGVEVVQTTKSASVRIKVTPIDRFGEFDEQKEAVRAGLTAAARLLELSSKLRTDVVSRK